MDKMVKGVVFLIEYRDDDKLVNVDLPEKLSHIPYPFPKPNLSLMLCRLGWFPWRLAFFMGEDCFFPCDFGWIFSSTLEAFLIFCHGS